MKNKNNKKKTKSQNDLEKDYENLMRDASARDILDDLGEISKEEVDYYANLKS